MLLLCYVLSSVSCHHKFVPASSTLNMEVKDHHGNPELLGPANRERLQQAPFDQWFVRNYQAYTVDSNAILSLSSQLKGKQLLIFMGTWCGDSKREVPRIFKILDACGIDSSSVRLITVGGSDSLYKQSPSHEERGLDVFRVPDLIVYDNGREMGRIIEEPASSLEKDLLAITGGQAYTPHFSGVLYLSRLFRQEPVRKIEKDLPDLAERLRPRIASYTELYSYTYVLRAAGQSRQAALVTRLNKLLFPQEPLLLRLK